MNLNVVILILLAIVYLFGWFLVFRSVFIRKGVVTLEDVIICIFFGMFLSGAALVMTTSEFAEALVIYRKKQ